ncbi:MAG: anthranilate synthase component I family protein [Phycisphaerae bacterium]|nr:anthranilate synthase component I family protein [Phycisphaerae bacterium]
MESFLGADAAERNSLVLDTARGPDAWNRFSYLADTPAWALSTHPATPNDRPVRELADLRPALAEVTLDDRDQPSDGRFVGGYAGYLSYELGAALEGVQAAQADDIPLPRMRWAFYDAVACYDHLRSRWELSALLLDGELAAERKLEALADRIRSARRAVTAPVPDPPPKGREITAASDFTRAQYERMVRRAKDYVAAGDIYQVNLAQRFTWPRPDDDAFAGRLFRLFHDRHPANYAAFLAWRDADGRDQAICSASPELFLSLHAGRVVTRPIKGTRSRSPDAVADRAAAAALLDSEKDAAELAMIVDLERNDLGRVCRCGSIRVEQPRVLESFAHVHHTVATIGGELAAGRDRVDLIEATFPGGSITGAPKIRAMQIIAELEPVTRSAYCGAIGWLAVDGSAGLNIAIRTAIVAGDRVFLHVGGGIVADSEPAAEYQETLDKAQGLAQPIDLLCGAGQATATPHPIS